MNAHAPPKQKRRLCADGAPKTATAGGVSRRHFVAKLFEKPFWFFEQWRGRFADRIDNEEHDR